MQFIYIKNNTTLSEFSELVGSRNVEKVLHINEVKRCPRIGKYFTDMCKNIINTVENVTWQRKSAILNTFTQDSDVFELAALSSDSAWKIISELVTFPGMLRIPETIRIPDSVNVIGNGVAIGDIIYNKAIKQLETPPHTIDPAIFNEYSSRRHFNILEYGDASEDPMHWFKLPWGEVTLYSSISGESMDFPVYPEELDDGVKANYSTMPDMLYQYEPWYVYNSSGPRQCAYKFSLHRDMWTGDHRDGKCNELIRFCESNCYPEYNGAAVNSPLVTLYISGSSLITGIMTDVSVAWDGPLGLDGWYLHCTITLNITEISPNALNYVSVRNKPLIG